MQWLLSWKKAIHDAQLPVFAANAAFFLLLSLFPALALLLGLISHLALSMEDFFSVFRQLIPEVLMPLFRDTIPTLAAGSAPLLSLSALTGLWSASRGIYGLLQGLRRICHDRENRSYLKLRLLAIVYTAAFLLALLLTFALYTLGRTVLQMLIAADAPIAAVLRFILQGRSGISFVFLSVLFLFIYRTFPPGRRTIRQALPGSLLTAGGWVLFSWLFSIWATVFSGYSKVYGSVAVVAMTMLWLYFCLEIVLLGALLNERLKNHRP